MTYSQIEEMLEERGLWASSLWCMMDEVEKQTGKYPEWNDRAEPWILRYYGLEE